jgi:hypothetical protein
MNGWQIAIMVAVFLAVDLVVIGAIMQIARTTLSDLTAKFPPVAPLPGAVRKEFQSFRFDLIGLGGCIHVTVDEKHLHLQPAWLPRVLMRMKPVSIPWSAITLMPETSQSRRFTWKHRARYVAFRVGAMQGVGPGWALGLAAPASAPAGAR